MKLIKQQNEKVFDSLIELSNNMLRNGSSISESLSVFNDDSFLDYNNPIAEDIAKNIYNYLKLQYKRKPTSLELDEYCDKSIREKKISDINIIRSIDNYNEEQIKNIENSYQSLQLEIKREFVKFS